MVFQIEKLMANGYEISSIDCQIFDFDCCHKWLFNTNNQLVFDCLGKYMTLTPRLVSKIWKMNKVLVHTLHDKVFLKRINAFKKRVGGILPLTYVEKFKLSNSTMLYLINEGYSFSWLACIAYAKMGDLNGLEVILPTTTGKPHCSSVGFAGILQHANHRKIILTLVQYGLPISSNVEFYGEYGSILQWAQKYTDKEFVAALQGKPYSKTTDLVKVVHAGDLTEYSFDLEYVVNVV